MSATGSWNNLRCLLGLVRRRGFFSDGSQGRNPASSWPPVDLRESCSVRYGGWELMASAANVLTWRKSYTTVPRNDKVEPILSPTPSGPPKKNFPSWAKWVLGSILTILVPYWKQEWEKFLLIEEEAEIVVQGAEKVAEAVEEVATTVEKVSAEVAANHPEDGKLKKTALFVEGISKATAQDAEATKQFLEKVDALKHDFDDLETMVEPVIEKLIPKKTDVK